MSKPRDGSTYYSPLNTAVRPLNRPRREPTDGLAALPGPSTPRRSLCRGCLHGGLRSRVPPDGDAQKRGGGCPPVSLDFDVVLTLTLDGEMMNATQSFAGGQFSMSGSGKKQ